MHWGRKTLSWRNPKVLMVVATVVLGVAMINFRTADAVAEPQKAQLVEVDNSV
jgi:hypothetical protein